MTDQRRSLSAPSSSGWTCARTHAGSAAVTVAGNSVVAGRAIAIVYLATTASDFAGRLKARAVPPGPLGRFLRQSAWCTRRERTPWRLEGRERALSQAGGQQVHRSKAQEADHE